MSLLKVQNLHVRFRTTGNHIYAVNDVSFQIEPGQKLALVGESGSGKSQIAFAIMGLLAKNAETEGQIEFAGKNLLTLSPSGMNKIRAKEIAIIFQDPMSSLNPYLRIERQLSEVLEQHNGIKGEAARKRILEILDAVQIPDAKNRLRQYPHEFSGGMRQRIVIAMSLLLNPKLILADEPTTALDVTVQAQIMNLLNSIQKDFGSAILLITHDLSVVAGFCDETMVLYGGRVMERAKTNDFFARPSHPYSRGLLKAIPGTNLKKGSLVAIPGSPPNLTKFPQHCPFAPRCQNRLEQCLEELPSLSLSYPNRACLLPIEELK